MEVYFGSLSRGEKAPGEKPGKPIRINKQFEYGGFRWICPGIYLCEEGIVLDLCRSYPAEDFRKFYEKWAPRIDSADNDEMTRAQKENPMNFLCDLSLYLHGKKLEGGGWSGTGWQPCFPEQNQPFSEELVEEYGLEKDRGWYIYRAHYSLKKTDHATLEKHLLGQEQDRQVSNLLTLQVTAQKEQIYFDAKIKTSVDCAPFSVELKHPLTGATHQFLVGACTSDSLDKMPAQLKKEMILPKKHCVLVYAVIPEFSDEEFFCVQDMAPSDLPIPKEKKNSGKVASAVSIIGGADGPTSIFLAGNIGEKSKFLKRAKQADAGKEVRWKTVCSSLTFEPVKEVIWKCSLQVSPFAPRVIPLDF